MESKFKLTYYDVTGLGETVRFLLSYGGLDFEDNRIPQEEWPKIKPTTPLGQIPLLEVDGKVLYQSTAICRYLGTIIGITGSTPLENWQIDAVMDTIIDFRLKLFIWHWEKDATKKQAEREIVEKETLHFYLSKFDEWAKQNGGYLALKKLTWVDVVFAAVIELLGDVMGNEFGRPIIAGYTHLEALQEEIVNIPNIKAWIEKRPPSNF